MNHEVDITPTLQDSTFTTTDIDFAAWLVTKHVLELAGWDPDATGKRVEFRFHNPNQLENDALELGYRNSPEYALLSTRKYMVTKTLGALRAAEVNRANTSR